MSVCSVVTFCVKLLASESARVCESLCVIVTLYIFERITVDVILLCDLRYTQLTPNEWFANERSCASIYHRSARTVVFI